MKAPSKLAILREKLVHATDLGDPARYFFEHFAEDPVFLESSRPTKDAMLTSVIEKVVSQMLGEGASVSRVRLMHATSHHIKHGSFAAGLWLGAVLYVEDLAKGLVMLSSFSKNSLTHYNRFSVLKTGLGRDVTLN